MTKVIELCQENLRIIRKRVFKLTLEKLAKYIDVSASTLRRAELGYKVKEATLNKILDFYRRYACALNEYRKQKATQKNNDEVLCHA